MGAESSKMLTFHIGQTGETHKTTAEEFMMEIVGILHEKLEEVKPGEKGGGEDDMEEAFKGEAVNAGFDLVEAHGRETVALGEVGLESETESILAERQRTVTLGEGVLESGAVVEAERQKRVALGEGVLESGALV